VKRKKAKSSKQPLTVAPGGAETKRVLVHWPMIVALVLAMGSALAAYQVVNFLGQGDLFGLRALEVGGLRLLDGDDVLAASGLEVGTNIFAVDLEEVEQRLENVCWIERAMVMRKPPDRLAVEIVERQRLAWVELGATYGIARDGVLLPKDQAPGESFADLNLPVISGLAAVSDTLQFGATVSDSTLVGLLGWWDEATAADAEFCLNVSRLEPLPGACLRLQMVGDGLEIRLPLDSVERNLRTLRRLMPRVYRDYPDPAYIDLRYTGQVVVGRKEAGVE